MCVCVGITELAEIHIFRTKVLEEIRCEVYSIQLCPGVTGLLQKSSHLTLGEDSGSSLTHGSLNSVPAISCG